MNHCRNLSLLDLLLLTALMGVAVLQPRPAAAQVAVEAGHGSLKQDATHPHWLSFSDGTFPYLVGTTNYELIGTPYSNITATIDAQAPYFNVMRVSLRPKRDLWNNDPDGGLNLTPPTDIDQVGNPFSGTWKQPAAGPLNQSYWSRWHDMMNYAAAKGVIIELILVRGSGDEEMDAMWSSGGPNATFDALINETKQHWNLIYCIANEWEEHFGGSAQTVRDLGNAIKARAPDHAVSVHSLQYSPPPSNFFAFFGEPWVDYATYQRTSIADPLGDQADWFGTNWSKNTPQINEEYGYEGRISATSVIATHWGSLIGGGYAMHGHSPSRLAGWYMVGAGWNQVGSWGTAQVQLGYMRDFMTDRVGFWMMTPNNSSLSQGSGYVLENTGREYLIALPSGGSFTLTLPASSDALPVESLDPMTGVITSLTATTPNAPSYSGSVSGFRIIHIGTRTQPIRPRAPTDLVVN